MVTMIIINKCCLLLLLKLNNCYVKLRSVERFVEFTIKTKFVKCDSPHFLFHLIAKSESREIWAFQFRKIKFESRLSQSRSLGFLVWSGRTRSLALRAQKLDLGASLVRVLSSFKPSFLSDWLKSPG